MMFNFLKRYKYTVKFHMKSGAVISARCNDVKIQMNNNTLVSYELDGVESAGKAFYVRIDDISAMEY